MERQLGRLDDIELGHRRRYEFAANRVSGRVLDAACGCGYGSKMLSDANCEVLGVDIDQKTIEYARRNYPGPKYLCRDIQSLDQGYFDWVVSFETIEHIQDPYAALKTFRESAENLIVSSPNSDHFPFKPESYQGDVYPHLRHYAPQEFEDLLSSCGWSLVERFGQFKRHKVVDDREGPFQVLVCR